MSNDASSPVSRPLHPSTSTQAPGSWVAAEQTRARQTDKAEPGFRRFALATANVLLSGVQTGLDLVGAPKMAAAVRDATVATSTVAAAGPPAAAAGPLAAGALGGGSDVERAYQMQRESQAFNLQLLDLQEQVQQENRQFTTLTNVMRAKHDTAKAALSNIRS